MTTTGAFYNTLLPELALKNMSRVSLESVFFQLSSFIFQMHEQKNSSEIMVHLALQRLLIMTGRFACLGEVGRLD